MLVVASAHSYHCRHTPDVSTGTPFAAEYNFWRPVLSGLDVVREMVSDPTGVPEICNFDRNSFKGGLGCLF
jgi:hypothetical protein